MKFGLSEQVINQVSEVFTRFPEVEEVVLYGSRAKGNFKPGSDIDLTLKGDDLRLHLLNSISLCLDDLLLPYTFDLSIFRHIDNADLLDHIQRAGKVFYKKRFIETHAQTAHSLPPAKTGL